VESLNRSRASVSKHPSFAAGLRALNQPEEFRDCAWQFSGPMMGFKGYFNPLAGYAHSSNAVAGVYAHLLRLGGVKFHLGPTRGRVTELIYSDSNSTPCRRCTGFKTADGREHFSRATIVALGAHAGSLLPELGHSIVARSWSVAHIQLSEAEANFLRGFPTTNVRDLGFFFEPDPATRLLKLCPMGAGYTNRASSTNRSLPPVDGPHPALHDYIPPHDETKLRALLKETIPWLADRPFVDRRLCWIADTRDSEYVVDFVPDTSHSLVVLSGDSGHGFKMMPIVGKWVVNLLAHGEQSLARWRWREEPEDSSDWSDEVSWRIGRSRNIGELVKERENNGRERERGKERIRIGARL
jgi:sarcosine oxidase / L-pipecolate oxidase